MELTFNQLSNANSPWNLPNIPFFDIITHWSYFKNRGGVIVFCISNTFVHFRRVCPTLPFNEDITSISSTAITDNSAQSFFLRTLLSIMWSAAITAVYLCFIFFCSRRSVRIAAAIYREKEWANGQAFCTANRYNSWIQTKKIQI